MNEIFGDRYAAAYDTFYAEKDYAAEADAIRQIAARHTDGAVSAILDLGCGTGGHAFRLAHDGSTVVGVDRSAAMLKVAREKARVADAAIEFIEGDIRTVALGRTFDVAIAMFAVVGYQTTNDDVAAVLRTARSHLQAGSLFLFDIWFGPAVIAQGPVDRFRTFDGERSTHLRASSGRLDIASHTCQVKISTWELRDGRLVGEAHEDHTMRYFFPQEIALFAEGQGFQLVDLVPFPLGEGQPDLTTWNVLAVLRAV